MLPIYLSYWGTNVAPAERLFMGWFGPRGLASIVFTIILLDANLENGDFVALTVALTVLASLILHGITAKPFANLISQVNKDS
jgi:NhaP-type Na+/H+ or K+/H+ antiporter